MLQKGIMVRPIGIALKAARDRRGWPASRIADALGVKVQAVYQWEKGKNDPSTANLIKAAELLGVDPTELMKGKLEFIEIEDAPSRFPREAASNVEPAHDAPPFRSQAGRTRDVPELGIVVGGSDGDFSMNGETIAMQPRPASLIGRDVFAVRVINDSMVPRFKEGELLYVERRREPVAGEDAVIELFPDEEDRPGPAFIKQLVSKNMQTVVVLQHNPKGEITYERRRVKRLYRVVPWNEVLGV